MAYPTDSILLVDKSEGESSHDVVRKIKKALNLNKVGHAGTLDPFATGLLIVLLGQGTKLSQFIMPTSKVYQATMRLGIETDTLDLTGRVVREDAVPALDLEFIREKTKFFVGEIEQKPPIFSALKCNGVRAYKLARKGREVILDKRKVFIHSLDVLDMELPDVTIKIKCAAGTYVRSLALDLGKALGTVAHLRSLRRLSSGSFDIRDAVESKDITKSEFSHFWKERVISLRNALHEMREIIVTSNLAEKIRRGYQPVLKDVADDLDLASCEGVYFKVVSTDELVAIVKLNASRRDDHVGLEIIRVFQ